MSQSDPAGRLDATPVCRNHPDREAHIRCQRCEQPICPDCMRPAAVGFQCPACVRDGARSVRRPTAPYGGQPSANPALTSIVLIGLNLAVWLGITATGGSTSHLVQLLALLPDTATYQFPDGSIDSVTGVAGGAWWQVITSAFSHVEVWHIGFNMLALWFLGPQLEMVLGRVRFLALYLISALTGSAAVMALSAPHTQTLGASGAIFGLMGGLLVVALKMRANVQQLVMWIGLNVALTVFAASMVSWQGHLGGLVGGAAVAGVVVYAPRAQRSWLQPLGLGLIVLVSLAAIALRTLALNG